MAKRKYKCKQCDFVGTGPSSLGHHYKAHPTHRPDHVRAKNGDLYQYGGKRQPKCGTCGFRGSARALGKHYKENPDHGSAMSKAKRQYTRREKVKQPTQTINFCPCCGFPIGQLKL
jgi:hypothetical protein